jgi:hypothetical protein
MVVESDRSAGYGGRFAACEIPHVGTLQLPPYRASRRCHDPARRLRKHTKPSASVNALYAQLDQASKGYEVALQQSREGNQQASQLTLTQSLDQLKVAAAHCGNTPGCDSQRFFSVFDRSAAAEGR